MSQQQQKQQKFQRKQDVVQRKTTAEIVNEAKNLLAGGRYIDPLELGLKHN